MGKTEMLVSKVASARFIATIALVLTFCVMWYRVGEPMNNVAVPVVLLVLQWYFSRNDRATENTTTATQTVTTPPVSNGTN